MFRQRFSATLTIAGMLVLAHGCAVDGDDVPPSEPSSTPGSSEPSEPSAAMPAPQPSAPGAQPEAPAAPAPGDTEPPSPDDEVDLGTLLSIAGASDITHGTQPYRQPAGAPEDERSDRVFVAFLSGGQEVPPVTSPAEGAMALIINKKQNRVRFVLRHAVSEPTVAHLHIGSAGENGDVAVALPRADRNVEGTISVTPAQVEQLVAGRVYVNVHSKTFAKGEIRGQVLRPGETVFVASMNGSEEVPPIETASTGQASLILNAKRDQVRFRVAFTGFQPTLLHLHRGIAGFNGDVAKNLPPVGSPIEGTFAVDGNDLQDLSLRRFYLNLHSAARPKGEVRGQILRPGESLFAAALSPAQEVPPVTADSTANAMIVLGAARSKFLYVVQTNAPVTVAHIHRAPAGSNGPVEVALDPVGPEMNGIRDLGPTRTADVERGLWYVNVHTAKNPMGELRGQVLRPGETLLTTALSGAEEVPAINTTATGSLSVILDATRSQIRYDGAFADVVATVAHLHLAPAGKNGPVAFPLMFSGTTVSGDQLVTPEQVAALLSAGMYANIHSAANAMGEIRGQLRIPGTDAGGLTVVPSIPAPPPQNMPAPQPHGH